MNRRESYRKGWIDALTAYAWWKDGTQYVGTSGVTLEEAIESMERTHTFDPQMSQHAHEKCDYCDYEAIGHINEIALCEYHYKGVTKLIGTGHWASKNSKSLPGDMKVIRQMDSEEDE